MILRHCLSLQLYLMYVQCLSLAKFTKTDMFLMKYCIRYQLFFCWLLVISTFQHLSKSLKEILIVSPLLFFSLLKDLYWIKLNVLGFSNSPYLCLFAGARKLFAEANTWLWSIFRCWWFYDLQKGISWNRSVSLRQITLQSNIVR